jgi:hypothetical protein
LAASPGTLIYWLAVLLLAAVGYWLQASNKNELVARRRLRDWRQAPGTVVSSHVAEAPHASLSLPGRLLKAKADFYKPVVEYTFQVGDKPYHSSKYKNSFVSRGEEWQSADRAAVEGIVASYPPAQPVTVYYDPDDPAAAYLELDASISRLFVFRTSGFVLILAASLIFLQNAYSTSGQLFAGSAPTEAPAVLPVASADLRSNLSASLGLACRYSGIYNETYESWQCSASDSSASAGGASARVSIYSRKQELAKTDLLVAKASSADAPAFFASLLPIALPNAGPAQLKAWIARNAPALSPGGPPASTAIQGVPFALSLPAANTLQLEIGELRH